MGNGTSGYAEITPPGRHVSQNNQFSTGIINKSTNRRKDVKTRSLDVETLIKQGHDVNSANIQGVTLLHTAIDAGDLKGVEALIQHNVNVDYFDVNGHSPLMTACHLGQVDIIEKLVAAKADVNLINERGESAVHYAVLSKKPDVLRMVVEAGGDINQCDQYGHSPLMLSCRHGNYNVTSALMSYKPDVTKTESLMGKTAMHLAAQHSTGEVVQLLLDHGCDMDVLDKEGNAPFLNAIKSKNHTTLDVLLKAGCDTYNLDGLNNTALGVAVRMGHVQSVRVLLDNLHDPDEVSVYGMTPLMIAAWKAFEDIVHTLLEYDGDPNRLGRQGCSALMYAILNVTSKIEEPRHNITRELLQAGADPNYVVKSVGMYTICGAQSHETPLIYSLSTGYESMIEMILLAGCNIPKRLVEWLNSEVFRQKCPCVIHSFTNVKALAQKVNEWYFNPRPLKQITRTAIRNMVPSKKRKVISSLPVPMPLKQFLLLQDLNYIKPKTLENRKHFDTFAIERYVLFPMDL